MKRLSMEELVTSGILQETNRRWFHPLGLALAVEVHDATPDRQVSKLVILDGRDDPGGFIFADVDGVDLDKYNRFQSVKEDRYRTREQTLGFIIQPLPGSK